MVGVVIDLKNYNKISLSATFKNMNIDEKFNCYRKLWLEAEKYKVLTDFPLHLDIELSGKCNLNCEFCFQNELDQKYLGLMRKDLFVKILDEGVSKGLCAIKLQIRGESFLHPELYEMIRLAKEKGILDVQITTNGTLLTKKNINRIFQSGLDGIIFSVDYHHEDGLKSISNKPYASVEESIMKFLDERDGLDKHKPWVRIQTAIPSETNNTETLQHTKVLLEKKFPLADIIVVSDTFNYKDDEDSIPNLRTHYRLLPCAYLMQRLSIFWDGKVTACCMDYMNKFQLGNLNENTIQEIWLSEKMQLFRDKQLSGERKDMPICKHCHISISPYDKINDRKL
jgi:radical SAM protein with 4Fe4S-binding SPASM domain